MKNKTLLGLLGIAALCIYSCQKTDNTASTDLASNLAVASADVASTVLSETSSTDVQGVAVTNFSYHSGAGPFHFSIPHLDSCATVTVSSTTYPKEIVIDYGTGCTSHHGHVKQGKIIIDLSDTISVAGASMTITYENFYVDSFKIDLSATMKNMGQNDSGNWVIEKKYEQTVTVNDQTSKQVLDETIEWLSGFNTASRSDDLYYKTGSGTITVNDTLTYSRTITSALLVDRTCGYIKSGIIELVKNGTTIVIDYGDGTCDSVATVTTNGVTEEIDLTHSKYNSDSIFGKSCSGFGHKKDKHHGS